MTQNQLHSSTRPISTTLVAILTTSFTSAYANTEASLPDLTGLTIEEAQEKVAATFSIEFVDSITRQNTIVEHWPSAGGKPGDTGILLRVSNGVIIPTDILKDGPEAAARNLKEIGFFVLERFNLQGDLDNFPEDRVFPSPGTRIDANSQPVVVVSYTKVKIMTDDADTLKAMGLDVKIIDATETVPTSFDPCFDYVERDYGVDVSPEYGSIVPRGSTVTLTYWNYIEEVFEC